jgi:hypothetical protein
MQAFCAFLEGWREEKEPIAKYVFSIECGEKELQLRKQQFPQFDRV